MTKEIVAAPEVEARARAFEVFAVFVVPKQVATHVVMVSWEKNATRPGLPASYDSRRERRRQRP
jgi:hypothetical protein